MLTKVRGSTRAPWPWTLHLTEVYRHTDHAVGLTMLAQSSVRKEGKSPQIKLVFRDPATINLIPNYEGQPMIQYFYLLSPLHFPIYIDIRLFHHRHRAALDPLPGGGGGSGWGGVAEGAVL